MSLAEFRKRVEEANKIWETSPVYSQPKQNVTNWLPVGISYEGAIIILKNWLKDIERFSVLYNLPYESSQEEKDLMDVFYNFVPENLSLKDRVKFLTDKIIEEHKGNQPIEHKDSKKPKTGDKLVKTKKTVRTKGVKMVFKPTVVPSNKKFSMLPLRLFLNSEGKFESLFWVKCMYLLNQWRVFNEAGKSKSGNGLLNNCKADSYIETELRFIWDRCKDIDNEDKLLPKYLSGDSALVNKNRVVPSLDKADDEKCIFLTDVLFQDVKSTSILVLKSLIQFHDITEYEQLVYWVKNHGLLNLYEGNLKRFWKKLTNETTT